MARLSRIVLPGIPHHVTQRGNRREQVFFEDRDYALYLELLSEAVARARVAIWADMEAKTGLTLAHGKRGPKPRPV